MSQLTRDQKLAMGGLGAAIVVTLVVTIVMPAIRLWSCEAGESPCGPEPSLSVEYGRLTPLSRVTEARVREGEDDDAEAERQQVLERAEEARIAEDEWQAERATREPLQVVARAVDNEAPYFVDLVSQQLNESFPGLTTQPGTIDVYAGNSSKADLKQSFLVTG